ncbi:sensor histidine kinase [Microbacterium sp. 22242]|uniref:sensor histidine kinase n=1 Tax=Microbacterium sp. 22242 TaxID=3453896 RepID=UPI003F861034
MTRINPLTWWSAGMNLAGALAVGYGLWRTAHVIAAWALALAVAGILAWVVRTLLAARRGSQASRTEERGETSRTPRSDSVMQRVLAGALHGLMVLAGGLTAVPTQGLGTAVLIVAIMLVTSDRLASPPVWGGTVLAGALSAVAGTLLAATGAGGSSGPNVLGLLAVLVGLVFTVVAGFSRRAQQSLLAERERASAEALRAQAAAERVAIARDLHDVLAHSLGGLVVQLDAAEALLDAGDAGSAATRVTAARQLAVEGLREAREAVRALREPADEDAADGGLAAAHALRSVGPAEVTERIDALLRAHEVIGGRAERRSTGAPRPIPEALAEALVRAVQEGLSNARKHAPGADARIEVVWHPDRVECIVQNRIPVREGAGRDRAGTVAPAVARTELAATGGGYGLRGVRERFEALGGAVQAGILPAESAAADDRFVLRVEAAA